MGKRQNARQWMTRVFKRLCWSCNVKLVERVDKYGSECPRCKKFYPELVRLEWERRIKFWKNLGYKGKEIVEAI